MDDGDFMCHPVLVLPFLQDFDVANAKSRGGVEPTENRRNLPPERKVGDVRSLAKTSAVTGR